MGIKYVIGDATNPIDDNPYRFIIHVTNNKRGWGRGFVMAISKKWKLPEQEFRNEKPDLGDVQFVLVETGLFVVNMCAQDGYATHDKSLVLDYEALDKCLKKVAVNVKAFNGSVHAPRFGSGLSGGSWDVIESIIQDRLGDVPVTIYDLK